MEKTSVQETPVVSSKPPLQIQTPVYNNINRHKRRCSAESSSDSMPDTSVVKQPRKTVAGRYAKLVFGSTDLFFYYLWFIIV